MDPRPSIELLESAHAFPGVYQIKVIGSADADFTARVLDVVRSVIPEATGLEPKVRSTPDGRHVSLTLDLNVQSAEQVREIYEKVRGLDGLKFLL